MLPKGELPLNASSSTCWAQVTAVDTPLPRGHSRRQSLSATGDLVYCLKQQSEAELTLGHALPKRLLASLFGQLALLSQDPQSESVSPGWGEAEQGLSISSAVLPTGPTPSPPPQGACQ